MSRSTFGTTALLAVFLACAWVATAGLLPGGGPQRPDCYVELNVQGVDNPSAQVVNNRIVQCTNGDACDADGSCSDDACTLRIAVCIGQRDPNLPACAPPEALRRLQTSPGIRSVRPAVLAGSACGVFVDVPVPLRVKRNGTKAPGRVALVLTALAERGTVPAVDRDKVVLRCVPRTDCAGVAPTTTTTLPATGVQTVTVGPGGAFRFDPATVTVRVGETVRWRWASGGHNVVSGTGGTADGRFCSTDDQGCAGAELSGSDTTYEHTFTAAGTFPYFCSPHATLGMTGRVIVEP